MSLRPRSPVVRALQAQIDARQTAAPDIAERWPTGLATLDRALLGGLVRGALNELLVSEPGTGIVEALLPALHRRPAGAETPRLLAWIHPFKTPYPPALAQAGDGALGRWLIVRPPGPEDHLWALEQALRSKACDAVVAHLGDVPDMVLRRLQLAAQEGRALGLFFRPGSVAAKASPAAVRLLVRPQPADAARRRRVAIECLRCRGATYVPPLFLEWDVDSLDERETAASFERALDTGEAFGRRPAARAHGA